MDGEALVKPGVDSGGDKFRFLGSLSQKGALSVFLFSEERLAKEHILWCESPESP